MIPVRKVPKAAQLAMTQKLVSADTTPRYYIQRCILNTLNGKSIEMHFLDLLKRNSSLHLK